MIIQHSLTTILKEHVTLELESIDRMYLNVYVPRLQTEAVVASFFKKHRGALFASSALMEPMSNAFRKAIDVFTENNRVPFFLKYSGHFPYTAKLCINGHEYLKRQLQKEAIGFSANRRLLDVQRLSHDCFVGHEALQRAQEPKVEANQRTSGLRFGDFKTHVLLQALLIFQLQVYGFSNRDLREPRKPSGHIDIVELTPGRRTYLLSKVRLHALIVRVPNSHRYRLTEFGLRLSLFYTRTYNRLLEPAAARILVESSETPGKSRDSISRLGEARIAECLAMAMRRCGVPDDDANNIAKTLRERSVTLLERSEGRIASRLTTDNS